MEPTHWLLRVSDGLHFRKSQSFMRWGINSKHAWAQKFIRTIKPGDKIWFIQKASKGKAIGVATFSKNTNRELGPLINFTSTNEELGWTQEEGEWDTEVHYTDLYDLKDCDLFTDIKSPLVGRVFNPEKCGVNLPELYPNIVRFSKAIQIKN
jgi:predicted secreted protein